MFSEDEIIDYNSDYKVILPKMIHWEITKKKEKIRDSKYYPRIIVTVTVSPIIQLGLLIESYTLW